HGSSDYGGYDQTGGPHHRTMVRSHHRDLFANPWLTFRQPGKLAIHAAGPQPGWRWRLGPRPGSAALTLVRQRPPAARSLQKVNDGPMRLALAGRGGQGSTGSPLVPNKHQFRESIEDGCEVSVTGGAQRWRDQAP